MAFSWERIRQQHLYRSACVAAGRARRTREWGDDPSVTHPKAPKGYGFRGLWRAGVVRNRGWPMAETGATAYYRLYAARCIEMSREAANDANRMSLLTMAQVWMALADQAGRNDKNQDPIVPERELAPQVAQQQQQPQAKNE